MIFEIGQPEHGWVNLTIGDGDFRLEADVSDVPSDFINEAIDALLRLLTIGGPQTVSLSLEPGYHTLLLNQEADVFSLSVTTQGASADGLPHEIEGSFKEVVLPIFRAIKGFQSRDVEEMHWPQIESTALASLVEVIEVKKADLLSRAI
ncbi:hypothetical protein SLH49_14315 [Cognatiyoonia sp. IB215446]|uniref:hypothetical protein n=1 Tax=Cognatiyoonia sp. IB215446 TaxID=3097355 RepID=UPI002A129A78|nr:hypothetical protein [Cognatiyoonia sp. IB215446]MDX8349156.1 hypothetical protein [Cognatiyoonia sp. IB215446]